ncbi:hypothetical protein [Mucilaginibacter sp. PAMB04168]|uniref:hypothetical protein n=1 Tax=Mucilaginibacter sp. PAMB04168 TaxID=3138567 RepID=UPI0031F60971
MNGITIEQADYIISYYSNLLTQQEQKALRYHRSTLKFDDSKDVRLTQMYLKTGWLSDVALILNYLNKGYIQFIMDCAKRILTITRIKCILIYAPFVINSHEHRKHGNADFAGMIGIKINYRQ